MCIIVSQNLVFDFKIIISPRTLPKLQCTKNFSQVFLASSPLSVLFQQSYANLPSSQIESLKLKDPHAIFHEIPIEDKTRQGECNAIDYLLLPLTLNSIEGEINQEIE